MVGSAVYAYTSTDDAAIRTSLARANDVLLVESDTDFDASGGFSLGDTSGGSGLASVVYRRPSGSGNQVVTATFTNDNGPGNFCHIYGHAIADSP